MNIDELLAQNEQLMRDNARLMADLTRTRTVLTTAQGDYRLLTGLERTPYDLPPIDCYDYLTKVALDMGMNIQQLSALHRLVTPEPLGQVVADGISASRRILNNS